MNKPIDRTPTTPQEMAAVSAVNTIQSALELAAAKGVTNTPQELVTAAMHKLVQA